MPFTSIRNFIIVFLTAPAMLLALLCPAIGQEPEWRLLDLLTHKSTSTCIGDPKTPLCAAETFAACYFSGYKEFCKVVGVDYDAEFGNLNPGPIGLLYYAVYYKFDEVIIGPEDIPDSYPKWGNKSWKPGDTALRTIWQSCKPDLQCLADKEGSSDSRAKIECRTLKTCTQSPSVEVIDILRKTGSQWSLIGNYRRGDLPRSFMNRK